MSDLLTLNSKVFLFKRDLLLFGGLLTCFSGAVSRTDMNGDLPLATAIKFQCNTTVVNSILMQYPEAAGVLNGEGHSPLHLAFKHNADDRTIMGLLNHAPDVSSNFLTFLIKCLGGSKLTLFDRCSYHSLLRALTGRLDCCQFRWPRKTNIPISLSTIC